MSFHKLTLMLGVTAMLALPGIAGARTADLQPNLMVSGDPADPIYANAGENLRNGVGSIFVEFNGIPDGGFICTASAISPTQILTAAHCVLEAGDTVKRIRFIVSAGEETPVIIDAAGFVVNPFYPALQPFLGAAAHGDLAVIELVEGLPAGIDTYELYRDTQEFGAAARHYGHGTTGTGQKGVSQGSNFFYARTGLNRYEALASDLFGFPLGDQLLLDFDSGGRSRNAMDWWFGGFLCHPDNATPDMAQDGRCTTFKSGLFPDFKGFGKLEVGVAPGDSGGPAFIDGQIAGVHSFGFTHGCAGIANKTDVDCDLNSSYGEMSGDVRVSFWADWIDAAAAGAFGFVPVPEPAGAAPAAADVAGMQIPAQFNRIVDSGALRIRSLRKPVSID